MGFCGDRDVGSIRRKECRASRVQCSWAINGTNVLVFVRGQGLCPVKIFTGHGKIWTRVQDPIHWTQAGPFVRMVTTEFFFFFFFFFFLNSGLLLGLASVSYLQQ